MKKILILLAGLFFATNTANAQSEVSINRPFLAGDSKTVSQARSIAITNTVLSIGAGITAVALFDNNTVQKGGTFLTIYGIVAGPSTGNFYAEDYQRGVIGMGARAIGAILMADATREVFGNRFSNALNVDDKSVSLTDTKMLIGEAFMLGGLIYNFISFKTSVEEYNSGGRNFSMDINSAVIQNRVAPLLTARFTF